MKEDEGMKLDSLKSFEVLAEPSIEKMHEFNIALRAVLDQLDRRTIFTEGGYSEASFIELLKSFVKGQRGSLGRTKPGSWSIAPDDDYMDSDLRSDFIFTPTYLVTAILSLVLQDYPELAESAGNYEAELSAGMRFCSYRGLSGSGYDADSGMIDALTILSVGKVPLLLENHPELSPSLRKALHSVAKEIATCLAQHKTKGAWGEDYADGFSKALEILTTKNNANYYTALKNK